MLIRTLDKKETSIIYTHKNLVMALNRALSYKINLQKSVLEEE